MLLKAKTIQTKTHVVHNPKTITVASKEIDVINREIQENVRKKEVERERGLEIAVRCRMR